MHLQSQYSIKVAQRTGVLLSWVKCEGQPLSLVDDCFLRAAAISSSSADSLILENECSPRMGSIQWLATSSRVSVSSPQEKRKVCVERHHLLNNSRSDSVSLNMLQLLEIKMDQWMPASTRLSQKSESRISRSTQWDQSLEAAQRKSKLMGAA